MQFKSLKRLLIFIKLYGAPSQENLNSYLVLLDICLNRLLILYYSFCIESNSKTTTTTTRCRSEAAAKCCFNLHDAKLKLWSFSTFKMIEVECFI